MRFVVSMTTIPDRLKFIEPVIDSVFQQICKPDRLYLNLPYVSGKGGAYVIPDTFLSKLHHRDRVCIHRCEEYGPITKLLPCLDEETDPETIIVTIDDDIYLNKHVFSILLSRHKREPTSVLAFSGMCVGKFPMFCQPIVCNANDIKVDLIQGVHTILYKREWLDKEEMLSFGKRFPKIVKSHDDHWISSYLSTKNIEKTVINRTPRYYFRDLPQRYIQGISRRGPFRMTFMMEMFVISMFLKDKNLYTKNGSVTSSYLLHLYILCCVPLFFLFRRGRTDLKAFFTILLILVFLYTFYMSYKVCLKELKKSSYG